ncbi:MAG TPA: hypothetical protein VEI50_08940 [Nitrospiraceae bacterium]|nr:hypothetical protein [Nitrospiraceae bacterium]
MARPLHGSLKQATSFLTISQPCGDSAEGQQGVSMDRLVGELGEERYSFHESSSRSFSTTLTFKNQSYFCQGESLTPTLFARTKEVQRLLIVGQSFRKMVLHIVYFANSKQLVTI